MVNGQSRYAQYMNSRGREIFGGEIDVELADAVRSIATRRSIKVTQLFREVLKDFVNSNGFSYEFKDTSSASERLKNENLALTSRLAALEAKLEALVASDEDEDDSEEELEVQVEA